MSNVYYEKIARINHRFFFVQTPVLAGERNEGESLLFLFTLFKLSQG